MPGFGGRGEWGATANEYGVSFCGYENILDLDNGDCGTTLWIYTKSHLNCTL